MKLRSAFANFFVILYFNLVTDLVFGTSSGPGNSAFYHLYPPVFTRLYADDGWKDSLFRPSRAKIAVDAGNAQVTHRHQQLVFSEDSNTISWTPIARANSEQKQRQLNGGPQAKDEVERLHKDLKQIHKDVDKLNDELQRKNDVLKNSHSNEGKSSDARNQNRTESQIGSIGVHRNLTRVNPVLPPFQLNTGNSMATMEIKNNRVQLEIVESGSKDQQSANDMITKNIPTVYIAVNEEGNATIEVDLHENQVKETNMTYSANATTEKADVDQAEEVSRSNRTEEKHSRGPENDVSRMITTNSEVNITTKSHDSLSLPALTTALSNGTRTEDIV